jgi:hypothetical protein
MDSRIPDAGCRMQDAGCRMQDAGCRKSVDQVRVMSTNCLSS